MHTCQQPVYPFIDISSLNYSWWYRFWRITVIFCICCFWSFYISIYGLFLYARTSTISILSNSNLGTVANNMTTLSLIFSRLIDGVDSEDSLLCSVSVAFLLFTDQYYPFLFLRSWSSFFSKFSASLLWVFSLFRLVLLRIHFLLNGLYCVEFPSLCISLLRSLFLIFLWISLFSLS
jgi:hypothetical protein